MKHKKTVCLDFDGVIHSYTSGWKGPRCIPDPPVPGAIEWITNFISLCCKLPDSICCMSEGDFVLAIYSSRSRYWFAKRAMKQWLVKHGLDPRYLEVIQFPSEKPPAHVLIDDRAITFTGKWPTFSEIAKFTPWNK